MKRIIAVSALTFASFLAHAGYEVPEWNRKARAEFAAQRFGIFIHWGLYANYAQGEWYLLKGPDDKNALDEDAYARMKDGFYPSKFDAKEWVSIFKDAGAKYVTITSRHHDGFSLWPSKVDDGYNIGNTPFKRDVLGELTEACREGGLQLNFYYSLMDWHRKDYPTTNGRASSRMKKLPDHKDDYPSYKRFMMAQIAELIDAYHPGNIWFDGEWDHAMHLEDGTWKRTLDWEFEDIYDLIHSKRVLVANNNHQPIREKEDLQLFECDLPGEGTVHSANQPLIFDRPVEQCDVIQPHIWGYKIAEEGFRPAHDIIARLARAAAKGSNLLMNIGPDGSGRLPARAVETLRGVGRWMRANGESIYGTSGCGLTLRCPITKKAFVVATRTEKAIYLHFLEPEVKSFDVEGLDIVKAEYLETGKPVEIKDAGADKKTVVVTRDPDNKFDVVVKLTLK